MKSWSERLSEEYRHSKKILKSKLQSLNDEVEADKEDIKIINSMIRDVDYVIQWLDTGIMPEPGAAKYKAYTYEDEPVYGVNGYWDESMGAFITFNNYSDPYSEIDDRIDDELEMKGYAETFRNDSGVK